MPYILVLELLLYVTRFIRQQKASPNQHTLFMAADWKVHDS